MSSQPNHPALLIPGPIEFDDAVLQSMSHYRYAVLITFLLA
jgi:alanine-glyoxylate transaminase/serine-glyoxylate transaminase/serine-pyruvate transaminase